MNMESSKCAAIERTCNLQGDTLFQLWKDAVNLASAIASNKSVELEIRLGSFHDVTDHKKFKSGILDDFFGRTINALKSTFSWVCPCIEETTEFFFKTGSRTIRCTYRNGKLLHIVEKTRKRCADLMLCNEAAFRIAVSIEEEVIPGTLVGVNLSTFPPTADKESEWCCIMKRQKQRHRFQHVSGKVPFCIDLTVAKASTADYTDKKLFEIEFEVFNLNFEHKEIWSNALMAFAVSLSTECAINESTFPMSIYYEEVLKPEPVLSVFWKYFPSSWSGRFPGSLPKTLKRSVLGEVTFSEYLVAEKTDGTRFMMLVTHDGAWLIDRQLKVYALRNEAHKLESFCRISGGNAGSRFKGAVTILDGEMVITPRIPDGFFYHLGVGVPCFIIFDVLYFQGVSLLDEPFSERCKVVRNSIIAPFRLALDENRYHCHLYMDRKVWLEAHCVATIAQRFFDFNGQKLFLQQSAQDRVLKLLHSCDGLIFSHRGPYTLGTTSPFSWKWKFADQLTIDVAVVSDEKNQLSMCGLSEGSLIPVIRRVDALENVDKLRKIIIASHVFQSSNISSLIIIEISFHKKSGKWRFHHIRNKFHPNSVHVIMETMEAIAEDPITIEEVIKHCTDGKK
jgi:hypothetical protein